MSAGHARELSARERVVCLSLRACIDIVSRHDGSEFDYDVLTTEFTRFGPTGKASLFKVLESDAGHADIAQMIASLGPLTPTERNRIKTNWSPEKASAYLPLILDGHPTSRDLLLLSLGEPTADVREQVRVALIRLPDHAERAPLPKSLQQPLLDALQMDPVAIAAPYLARFNPAGHEDQYAALLRSGKVEIVTAAYTALYRNNPAQAFNMLLTEMKRMDTPAQARAVGQMLARRHTIRKDGFYLKFSRDMSGDSNFPVVARASGIEAVLTIAQGALPDLTPERAEALSYLIKGNPFRAQDHYLPYLKGADANDAMRIIWETAQSEKWINRDRIAASYSGHPSSDVVTIGLLQSDDLRSFSAGLRRAKPVHGRFIRAQIDHPVKAIAVAARMSLGLPVSKTNERACSIGNFDFDDMRAQMPFFESGWMAADNGARVSLARADLTTAHPSATGWLAGYDLVNPASRSPHNGGALLHYDNTSGAFQEIGSFAGPVAILPAQPLQLGQTAERFWVVDLWGGDVAGVSAYMLDLASNPSRVKPVNVLPKTVQSYSVAPNGDLLIAFDDPKQMPISLSKTGQMSLACSAPRHSNTPRAPQ